MSDHELRQQGMRWWATSRHSLYLRESVQRVFADAAAG